MFSLLSFEVKAMGLQPGQRISPHTAFLSYVRTNNLPSARLLVTFFALLA